MLALAWVGDPEKKEECTGPKEECNEGKDHLIAKVLAEEEHAQHDPDGYNAQDGHGPLDQLQYPAELLDVA